MTVTISDVAALARVSNGTVSNVLNGRSSVSKDIAERVQVAIDELGYVRNDVARQLRAGQSRAIALIVHDASNPFFADVARGAEDRAAQDGYVLFVCSNGQDTAREDAQVDQFRQQRVAGVLLTPASDRSRAVSTLSRQGTPVVLVDQLSADPGVLSVSVDDVEGGFLAVSHLLDQGRRRIMVVTGPLATRQVAHRVEGARAAAARVPDAQLVVHETNALTVSSGRTAGEVLRKLPTRPDAVFAANDLLALGVMQALTLDPRIDVPGDVALIGYDDIDFAASAVVPLSSIRQPAYALGHRAVDMMLAGPPVDDPFPTHTATFRPELIVRASSVR